ncbi:hypothetical protein HN51_016466 [Arachis hypogaea]
MAPPSNPPSLDAFSSPASTQSVPSSVPSASNRMSQKDTPVRYYYYMSSLPASTSVSVTCRFVCEQPRDSEGHPILRLLLQVSVGAPMNSHPPLRWTTRLRLPCSASTHATSNYSLSRHEATPQYTGGRVEVAYTIGWSEFCRGLRLGERCSGSRLGVEDG